MPPPLDPAKRLAAGHMCMTMFHLTSSSVAFQLSMVAARRKEGLGDGLTQKEQELIQRLSSQMYETSEILRRLGWRLQGRENTVRK